MLWVSIEFCPIFFFHRIIESLRLEKVSNLTTSNLPPHHYHVHWPCPSLPHEIFLLSSLWPNLTRFFYSNSPIVFKRNQNSCHCKLPEMSSRRTWMHPLKKSHSPSVCQAWINMLLAKGKPCQKHVFSWWYAVTKSGNSFSFADDTKVYWEVKCSF